MGLPWVPDRAPLPLPTPPGASQLLAEKSQRGARRGGGLLGSAQSCPVPRLPLATGPHGNAEQGPAGKRVKE